MTPDERTLVQRSRFRGLYENAAGGTLATISAVEAAIDELGISDPPTRRRLLADVQAIAESRRDEGGLVAFQRSDAALLALERQIIADDQLLDAEAPRTHEQETADRQSAKEIVDGIFEADVVGGRAALAEDLADVPSRKAG